MNRISKTLIVVLCASGVALAWILPQIILAIHDACGMSTTHEFEVYGLIDERKLDELRSQEGYENYSIEQRVRSSGATGLYLNYQSVVLTAVFALIALIVMCVPGQAPATYQTEPQRSASHNRTNNPIDRSGGPGVS